MNTNPPSNIHKTAIAAILVPIKPIFSSLSVSIRKYSGSLHGHFLNAFYQHVISWILYLFKWPNNKVVCIPMEHRSMVDITYNIFTSCKYPTKTTKYFTQIIIFLYNLQPFFFYLFLSNPNTNSIWWWWGFWWDFSCDFCLTVEENPRHSQYDSVSLCNKQQKTSS